MECEELLARCITYRLSPIRIHKKKNTPSDFGNPTEVRFQEMNAKNLLGYQDVMIPYVVLTNFSVP